MGRLLAVGPKGSVIWISPECGLGQSPSLVPESQLPLVSLIRARSGPPEPSPEGATGTCHDLGSVRLPAQVLNEPFEEVHWGLTQPARVSNISENGPCQLGLEGWLGVCWIEEGILGREQS